MYCRATGHFGNRTHACQRYRISRPAYLSRERRRQNQLAAVAACLLPIVWFVVGNCAAAELNEWVLKREIAQSEIPAFIADLTNLTDLLGRAPKDEKRWSAARQAAASFVTRMDFR